MVFAENNQFRIGDTAKDAFVMHPEIHDTSKWVQNENAVTYFTESDGNSHRVDIAVRNAFVPNPLSDCEFRHTVAVPSGILEVGDFNQVKIWPGKYTVHLEGFRLGNDPGLAVFEDEQMAADEFERYVITLVRHSDDSVIDDMNTGITIKSFARNAQIAVSPKKLHLRLPDEAKVVKKDAGMLRFSMLGSSVTITVCEDPRAQPLFVTGGKAGNKAHSCDNVSHGSVNGTRWSPSDAMVNHYLLHVDGGMVYVSVFKADATARMAIEKLLFTISVEET